MEKEKSTQVTGCKQCKKGLTLTQKSLIVFSIYILLTSIYGTVQIIKDLNGMF
jgi:hypothetical protein